MGLIEDHERIEAGRMVKDWKATAVTNINHVQLVLDKVVAMKTTYPDVAVELDGYIAQAKIALQNLINRY